MKIANIVLVSKKYSKINSFKFAFRGLSTALKNEPNFLVQIILGLIALFLGFFLKISSTEWLILILTISVVLILELVNTSIEALVDLVSPEIKEKAKTAKDVVASAVLISSISSIAVGLIIFLPKLISLLN